MNLNDLKEMCDKDVKIDSTDLDGYSISIPELAHKYLQLAFDERKTLRFLQGLYDVLLRQRWLTILVKQVMMFMKKNHLT